MEEHGSYRFYFPGSSVMWIHILDSWNVQTAVRYCADCKKLINGMDGPIARVLDLRLFEFGEPDIVPIVEDLYAWMQEHGVTRQIDLVESELVMRLHLNKIEKKSDIHFSVSKSVMDIFSTLENEGWKLDSSFELPENR